MAIAANRQIVNFLASIYLTARTAQADSMGNLRSMPKTKVLIVDDEPLIRWVITEMLKGWDYEPLEAATAAAALQTVAEAQPVAALLDINLPDASGFDLLREIKRRRPATVVIMITGELIVENAVAAWRNGAADFIGKPINADELRFVLARALEAKRPAQAAVVASKPRLLIVADSAARAHKLSAAFSTAEVEITSATSTAELDAVIQQAHDLALVDVAPTELRQALQTLRSSAAHNDIPVLVRHGRIATESSLAGVLPKHRAMPCSDIELLALAQRRLTSIASHWRAKPML